jgi:hypothetical protein
MKISNMKDRSRKKLPEILIDSQLIEGLIMIIYILAIDARVCSGERGNFSRFQQPRLTSIAAASAPPSRSHHES